MQMRGSRAAHGIDAAERQSVAGNWVS